MLRIGSDDFHSTPSHPLADKINNPANQLTAIHESSTIHTVAVQQTEPNSNYHLQVLISKILLIFVAMPFIFVRHRPLSLFKIVVTPFNFKVIEG